MLRDAMRNAQLAALFAIAGVVGTPPAVAQDYDENGCWFPANGCVQWRQHDDKDSDTVIITTVTNNCGGRIAVRLCNESESGGSSEWICHNYTLSDGEDIEQYTFSATGAAELDFVGSSRSGNDSTCRRNFSAPPR